MRTQHVAAVVTRIALECLSFCTKGMVEGFVNDLLTPTIRPIGWQDECQFHYRVLYGVIQMVSGSQVTGDPLLTGQHG